MRAEEYRVKRLKIESENREAKKRVEVKRFKKHKENINDVASRAREKLSGLRMKKFGNFRKTSERSA